MLDRSRTTKTLRCAIYTRKSSEEGLEQDFNSLHAQREACEAYITSQRHEGWRALLACYDDGGFSGGTMVRPGLKRLLEDVQSGLIDVVVVYKVDRLTRSLTDFAKIVDTFDGKGVSFVSVTQSFNTTTSMGRLTLNVLLSFAQFEREVTGERIRDKIAASKKKGLWMGGYVPMGYAADGRTLKIVEEDASVIRGIFDRFLVLRSILRLQDELEREGKTTPTYVAQSTREHAARVFSKGHLRQILKNPIYVGEIAHKGERFSGQHPALIERDTFDAVQKILAEGRNEKRVKKNAKNANLLSNLLFDEQGTKLFGSHANKNGRRYRYYVTKSTGHEKLRIPAREIEPFIVNCLAEHFKDSGWLLEKLIPPDAAPDVIQRYLTKAADLANELSNADSSVQRMILPNVLVRIIICTSSIRLEFADNPLGLTEYDPDHSHSRPHRHVHDAVFINIDAKLMTKGKDQRLIIAGRNTTSDEPPLNKAMIKAIARGVTWYEDLCTDQAASLRDIATRENVSERYVAQLLRLAFLAPKTITAFIDGDIDLPISVTDLAKGIDLPMAWGEQKTISLIP